MSISTEYTFETEPDDGLKCLICLEVASDPWQHGKCGRLFCKECLDKYGMGKPCPNCKREKPQYFEDNKSNREIRGLPVLCGNPGCHTIVELSEFEKHVDRCEHTVISCKYVSIGCDVKLKRKDMRAHEQDDKAHLNKAIDTVVKLEHRSQSFRKGEPMIFEIVDYQKKKDNNEVFTSPSFYTSPNGYHMKVKVHANGDGVGEGSHVSIFVHILEGKYDKKLKWPFIGTVTIELLNQLEDKNHHIQRLSYAQENNKNVGDDWGYPQYIPHSKLSHDSNSNTQYLKDDTLLYFRISFQVPDHKPWLQTTV